MTKRALLCGIALAACSGGHEPAIDSLPSAAEQAGRSSAVAGRAAAVGGGALPAGSAAVGGAGRFAADGGAGSPAVAGASAGPAAVGGDAAVATITGNTCADSGDFTRALRLEFDVSWPATIGLDAGSGAVVVFVKLRYREVTGQWLTEHRPCGNDLPVLTTSLLVDNLKSYNRIPSAAFDSPNMPVGSSIVSSTANMLSIDSGPGLLGIALQVPDAPWPEADAVVPADHDGDGKPGVTAIPETGAGFITPPVNVSQDSVADQIYVAARVRFTRHAPQQSCSALREGTADIDSFNYAIVGCHVQGGGECAAEETRFIARAAPQFEVSPTGRWMQREVPADAKCGDVRAAFDAP